MGKNNSNKSEEKQMLGYISVAIEVINDGSITVQATPLQELGSRAEQRRQQRRNESYIDSGSMDPVFWMCLSMPDGVGGDDGEALCACCLVLIMAVAAAGLAIGAKTMASAVYRTFKRNDNDSITEVVNCLEKLDTTSAQITDEGNQSCVDLYDFVAAVRESHHTGLFSSTRTSKDFDLRKEWCGPNESEKNARANPTNLITYLKQEGAFTKSYTNNGRNLFNRTIFKGQSEIAIQKIRKMSSAEQVTLIKNILDNYKDVRCFSSGRSIELFNTLSQNSENDDSMQKIAAIVKFLRGTDKKQRMHKAIMDAVDSSLKNSNVAQAEKGNEPQ